MGFAQSRETGWPGLLVLALGFLVLLLSGPASAWSQDVAQGAGLKAVDEQGQTQGHNPSSPGRDHEPAHGSASPPLPPGAIPPAPSGSTQDSQDPLPVPADPIADYAKQLYEQASVILNGLVKAKPSSTSEVVHMVTDLRRLVYRILDLVEPLPPSTSSAEAPSPVDLAQESSPATLADRLAQVKQKVPVVEASDSLRIRRDKALTLLTLAGIDLGHEQSLAELADVHLFGKFGMKIQPQRAFDYYSRLAHSFGNATAQYFVGFMYATGVGVQRNQAKANLYLTFAALSGHVPAEVTLGYRYSSGIGTPSKCAEAANYYKRAASKVIAHYLSGPPLGRTLPPGKLSLPDEDVGGLYGPGASGGGNPSHNNPQPRDGALTTEDILQYYTYSANRGDAVAQLILAAHYYRTSPPTQHTYRQALRYFKLAAAQMPPPLKQSPEGQPPNKYTEAQENKLKAAAQACGYIGKMIWRGEGVQVDSNTARRWFEKGAARGDVQSLNALGVMWRDGLAGYTKDPKSAYEHFLKAAEGAWPDAQVNLGELFYLGKPKDFPAAVRYYGLAARHGHLLALHRLGQINLEGHGTLPDCRVAVAYFKSVVEKADWFYPDAYQGEVAYDASDYVTALLHFLISSEMGLETSQTNAAWLMDQGVVPMADLFHPTALHNNLNQTSALGPTATDAGPEDPYGLAMVYWNRAANQGNTDARVKVGDYWYYGLGTNIRPPKNAKRKAKFATGETPAGDASTYADADKDDDADLAAHAPTDAGAPEDPDAPAHVQGWVEDGAFEPDSADEALPPNAEAHPDAVEPESEPFLWDRVLTWLHVLPRSSGARSYKKAAMYYQVAAESEYSSLAMWNLGWMHEHGVGVPRDLHLAKRYYDKTLATNPESYMPVMLALAKLQVKFFWAWLTGESPTASALADQADAEADDYDYADEDEFADPMDLEGEYDEDQDYNWGDWWGSEGRDLEEGVESGLVLCLCALGALLVWYRQMMNAQRRQQEAALRPAPAPPANPYPPITPPPISPAVSPAVSPFAYPPPTGAGPSPFATGPSAGGPLAVAGPSHAGPSSPAPSLAAPSHHPQGPSGPAIAGQGAANVPPRSSSQAPVPGSSSRASVVSSIPPHPPASSASVDDKENDSETISKSLT